jgi:hypothetical protein
MPVVLWVNTLAIWYAASLLHCRQKQKNLLEGVVSQRESLQQRLYQAEVQVGAEHNDSQEEGS